MLTVVGIAVGGLVAYAVYFDYKRRTDATFRRQLRKEKKRVIKSQTPSEASASIGGVDANELRTALEKVRQEEVPAGPEEKEQYFMTQVGMGEQLCAQGPAFHLSAAMCFYRALRVYPSPVELIVIYEKTVPGPVFQLVMQLTNMDVKDRVEGYYDCFPPKAMNVAVKTVDVPQSTVAGAMMRKKVLVCTKDFQPGDLIYKEEAVVTALDTDLQGLGTHCSHCLRAIEKDMAIRPTSDRFNSVYCSKDCQIRAKTHSQGLLFTLDSALPEHMATEVPDSHETRDRAQAAFAEYLTKTGKAAPELVARFIARQVSVETAKIMPPQLLATPGGSANPVATDGGDYTLYDHLERLRYLEVTAPAEETNLLKAVLQLALPGLEQFVTEERHASYLGGMAYNAFGVCYGGGRDDKPTPTARPEDVEKTRTPYGTEKQVGAGFYVVSSYLGHSCKPSARPSFSNGTSELHLIANHALKAGDELTVAYVDVTQHEENAEECRRRRRMELVRGWRFACTCSRCAEEAGSGGETDGEPKDESRVSEVVMRVEGA
ncbi:MAS20-domain-containing protein [Gyrodon lividus]|nr:MAS20-domain-containing protein [Gyrodon lividus]